MFQTISEIGTTYHISAIKAGRLLYALGIRDREHPVQKGFPFEQYITHGIAQPVTNSNGDIRYFKYDLDTIRNEFQVLVTAEADGKKIRLPAAASSILTRLSHTLVRINILLEALPNPQLQSVKMDITEICALLEADSAAKANQPPQLDARSTELFETLKAWRKTLSKEKELPAYIIASNTVLEQIAFYQPMGIEALKTIKGIGEKKAESYGTALLELVSAFNDERRAHD